MNSFYLGWRQFIRDIELMVGARNIAHWMYFIVCWLGLSPLGIIVSTYHSSMISFLLPEVIKFETDALEVRAKTTSIH